MMDMRQHSGGAMSASSLQYSPQATISNDNYFLLDPNQSPSSSMDLGGFNPSFASQITSDFSSSFLESISQNSFAHNLGSTMGSILPQAQIQSGLLLPADEWSGTSNSTPGPSSSHQHQQGHQSSPNQCQSSLSPRSLAQSGLLDSKKSLQQSYDSFLAINSQTGQEAFGPQPSSSSKGLSQGDEFPSGQGRFQGLMKQTVSQGSQSGSQLSQGANRQVMFQNQAQNTDFQGGYACQQPLSQPATAGNVQESSQDVLEDKAPAQLMGFDRAQVLSQQANIEATQKHSLHPSGQGHRASGQVSVFQGSEGDSSIINYQVPNQQAFLQRGQVLNQNVKLAGAHLAQQSGLQTDQGMQVIRALGLPLQGKSTQPSLQSQVSNQYLNFSAQTASGLHSPNIVSQQSQLPAQATPDQLTSFQSQPNAHPFSVLLQPQSSAQVQTFSQAHAVNQQAAANQQAIYQVRQLQPGNQQMLFHTNQQNPFQSSQASVKQTHAFGGTHGLHLGGAQQMLAQLQPRLLNPIFQELKAGRRLSSPTCGMSFFGNGVEGNIRSQMPVAIASRCVQVLMMYIQEQRKRPPDNEIIFWRNLVRDYFVPGATKRWCLSSYNSSPMGRHAQGLFPMDCWFCNLCGVQPGRGFESSTDVLPRLFKIKYDSGLIDELLFLDVAEEKYMLPSGRLVLEFPQAVHESIFPELRVVRYGRLRVTFSSSFKIYSWEFCTKVHEEVVPRKNLLQQAQQLAKLVMEADEEGFDKNIGNLKSHCNEFTSMAKQLALKLDAPNVNDLGFSKRYVRCLQIAEVVNSMKDLISFERMAGVGPIESLTRFPTVRKMQSEGLLSGISQSTLSQMINQLTRGVSNTGTSHAQLLCRSSVPQIQGHVASQFQNTTIQGAEPALSKLSSSVSQLQAQVRTQMEAQNSGLIPQQLNGDMQAARVQAQSQSSSQLLGQFNAQSISPLQGHLVSQAQSQLASQASGHQSLHFGQLGQQIYESAGTKQSVHQHVNQVLSQSHSLNQTGQQSLPGTPQSEMSDIRSNT